MKKIACFTNESDTEKLSQFNDSFKLEFIESFNELPDSDFFIVSLRQASEIYDKFVEFMRQRPESRFLFLDVGMVLMTDEDFTIRDESNTVYAPDGISMFSPTSISTEFKGLLV